MALTARLLQSSGQGPFAVACVRALVRDTGRRRILPAERIATSAAAFFSGGLDVVVEAMGGVEPARALVAAALDAGLPVVTCNKSLVARHGPALSERARARGVGFAYDAAVLAGVPFVGALERRPNMRAVTRIAGIVNGTSHSIVSAMARGASAGRAVADAIERGYAEPDPTADTSGLDAAEKLAILLHLCGQHDADVERICRHGLDRLDAADFAGAALLSGTIKPIAYASLDPGNAGAWVGPAFVPGGHLFASFTGVDNVLELHRPTGEVLVFAGPGAGPDVTAATLVDDVVEVVGRTLNRQSHLATWPRADETGLRAVAIPRNAWRHAPAQPWFVRISKHTGLTACESTNLLSDMSVPCERVVADTAGVYALTAPLPHAAIEAATEHVRSRGASANAWPVLMPCRRD